MKTGIVKFVKLSQDVACFLLWVVKYHDTSNLEKKKNILVYNSRELDSIKIRKTEHASAGAGS